jgi:hypothetical protein
MQPGFFTIGFSAVQASGFAGETFLHHARGMALTAFEIKQRRKTKHRRVLASLPLTLLLHVLPGEAAALDVVSVSAPDINCVYDPSCGVTFKIPRRRSRCRMVSGRDSCRAAPSRGRLVRRRRDYMAMNTAWTFEA